MRWHLQAPNDQNHAMAMTMIVTMTMMMTMSRMTGWGTETTGGGADPAREEEM